MEPASSTLDLASVVLADHCRLRLPSRPEWITGIVEFLVQRALQCGAIPVRRANRLTAALHEALTNSILHGNLGISSDLKESSDHAFAEAVTARCADPAFASRTVEIQASYDGTAAQWVFADQGEGFDVAQALNRLDREEHDPLRPSGRGLFLIRAFTDAMHYDVGGRRLTLTLWRSEEKRGQPRIPLAQEIRVAPIDGNGQVRWEDGREAVACDISAQGIGFFQASLTQSMRVLITIPTPGESISLPAEVRHWKQVGDCVEVGCRFESASAARPIEGGLPLQPAVDAVVQLVDRLADQTPIAERRTATRLPYTETLSIQTANDPALPAFARDLSRTGICFFTTTRLPLDAVRLSLPSIKGGQGVTIRAQVVRCTRVTDGFYDVAARFLPG